MVGGLEYDHGYGPAKKKLSNPHPRVPHPGVSSLAGPPPPPQVSISALDRSGNVRLRGSDSPAFKQYVFDNWDYLDKAALKQFYDRVSDSSPDQQIFGSNGVERLSSSSSSSSRFLQTEPRLSTATAAAVTKQIRLKTAAPKRKAITLNDSSEDDDDDDDDEENWSSNRNLRITLHIANEAEVVHFLKMRFTQIQQLATKVIAKAWIKAICPKKQANYPYVDSNPREDHNQKRRRPRHEGPPRIPNFWPDLELCRHKEPDHTRKTERTYLLVHLLRLRWTEKEWIQCNGAGSEIPGKIKSRNWVGFLRDAFPISKLDEVQGGHPEKIQLRRFWLKQIYEVAEKEQTLRRRIGNPNLKQEFAAGPGWVPFGNEIARSTTHKTRRISREESVTPSTVEPVVAHSDSQSDAYEVTPESEVHNHESRSEFLVSGEVDAREEKIEYLASNGFGELAEAQVPAEEWTPVLKADPDDEPVAVSIGGIPSTCARDVGYYAPVWSGNMANVQQQPTAYGQCPHFANVPLQWYESGELGKAQQIPLANCPTTIASNGLWNNGYRQNLEQVQPVTSGMPLQNQYASLDGVHQMASPAPFGQAVMRSANDTQTPIYGVSGLQYAAPFGNHGNSGEYHQDMYGRWP